MIPIKDRRAADTVLEMVKGSMRDYRYDMLSFRLALCLRAPDTWAMMVDAFPDVNFTCMIRRSKAEDDFDECLFDVIRPRNDVIDLVAEMIIEFRETIGKPLVVVDITDEELNSLMKTVGTKFRISRPTEQPFATFILDEKHLEIPPLPDGYTIRELDHSAPYVNQFNADQGVVPGIDMKYFLCDFIQHLPSAGIFNQTDQLIGYMLTNDYGSIGKLYVHTDYRRRGFATILIAHMTNRILDEKYLEKCLINANISNEKSYACFQKLGYKYVDNGDRNWVIVGDGTQQATANSVYTA